jgi:hypothetical protein
MCFYLLKQLKQMFLYCLFTGPALSQLGPALKGVVLELSTLVCSSTHNNTLQVLENNIEPSIS